MAVFARFLRLKDSNVKEALERNTILSMIDEMAKSKAEDTAETIKNAFLTYLDEKKHEKVKEYFVGVWQDWLPLWCDFGAPVDSYGLL